MHRILIEGIGGVGGVVAGKLVRGGFAPVLITHNPEITNTINQNGLRITTPKEHLVVPARAHTSLDDIGDQEPFDIALLVMKATAAIEAARNTMPLLDEDSGYVVTFQNGIIEDAMSEAIGADRVVSAIVGWGGTMHGPGIYEQTSGGTLHIGELDGQKSKRIYKLAEILEEVCPVVITDNIRGALWSKLAINCTITTMGALTGTTLGEMLQDKRVRQAFLTVYREVVDTAHSLGIKLERVAANPKLLYQKKNASAMTRFIKDKLVKMVAKNYGKLKSSSLQSLERGRQTEIDYLNGYVVEKADEAGIHTPLNQVLVRMIKELETKEREVGPDNLKELLATMD